MNRASGLGLGIYLFEEGYSFLFLKWFIKLSFLPHREPRDICESWSISYMNNAIFLYFGTKGTDRYHARSRCKIIYMPWDWGSCVRSQIVNEDGILVDKSREYEPPYSDKRKIYAEPYRYVLRGGEVQERIATFTEDEMEWRWRITHGLPFKFGPKKVRRSIWVHFNGEVGERTGSWKGGTTGCGYDMLPGETPTETLRRMEKERVFN